ncbi:hypothetical protein L8P27_05135 [Enterobacter asburiae]|uniref:hypothetical protein n=1 Tax=Enterobacter asburiae TaxID=61645 RepID=UPI0020033B2A|nr:hypothetical protein [Enterobacter asburiae]MCK7227236.1 hypothetical protein [Enterobacter asburiae]
MVEPITQLEADLANDSSGSYYLNILKLLDDALQTMEVNNQKYDVKEMTEALLAAASIVEAVGSIFLQKHTHPLV